MNCDSVMIHFPAVDSETLKVYSLFFYLLIFFSGFFLDWRTGLGGLRSWLWVSIDNDFISEFSV